MENETFDNDLEERLLSMRNMIDLALLAFRADKMELVPTAIEGAHLVSQILIDEYCVAK